jgi:hypothetical protein
MLNACPSAIDFDVYQPRNPKASAYYRCVEDELAAFTTMPPPWYAHHMIPVSLPPAPRAYSRREKLFRYEVFKMHNSEGKINDVIIENMMNWPPARRAL